MRAATHRRYGAPEVVSVVDAADPAPARDQVLVRVLAASVGAADAAARSGDPKVVRLFSGLLSPRHPVLGSDVAGEVVAVGADVRGLTVGDRVVGVRGPALGGHAQLAVVQAAGALALLPPEVTPEQAVALCDGAMTALPFLRDHGRVRAGHRVLVNGASGAVGSAGVQLARLLGAHVTAVTSTPNVPLARDLGAHAVVDYRVEDFTASDERWDVVFDAVGKSSFRRARRVLAPQGVYLSTVPGAIVLQSLLTRRASIAFTGLRKNAAKRPDLAELVRLAATGSLTPLVDSVFPLDEAQAAHTRVDTGRKRGTVVLRPHA
ncbi:NAD(P)-dependent alcohol dehydrogenase [Oerskovia turbata]